MNSLSHNVLDRELLRLIEEARAGSKDAREKAVAACWHRLVEIAAKESTPTAPLHARARPMPSLGGYEIAGEVARGGMGIVYRAWQQRMQRWVALKCLPPGFAHDTERLRRFRQEAQLAGQLTEHGIL